jgi:coenzyme F420-reducing hydrogenase delta subunit
MQAHVDPAKCVGCGICAGSCDSVGIGIDWLPVQDERKHVDQWLGEAAIEGERPNLAFVCGESAGGRLSIDRESGICEELPGYRVLEVPCAGWLHPLNVERALRRGAADVLIVSCGTGACLYREGTDWLSMRLAGERAPALRSDKVDRDRIHLLPLDRTRKRGLIREAAAIRSSGRSTSESVPGRALSGLAAALLAVVVAGGLGLVSDLGYASPGVDDSELVVTFKHPGQTSENCRDLTEEEKARRPVHMRKDRICDRRRSSVRLWVTLDGATVLKSSYPPGGVWGDGNSVAIEHIPVSIGEHRIGVAVGDGADPNEWSYRLERTLTFDGSARRVIAFDRLSGFTAH